MNGYLSCAERTDANGYLACTYHAPQKAIVERVVGRCATCNGDVNGAITVTKPPVVLGYFNGVWNTEFQSSLGLDALRGLIGQIHQENPIRFEYFYNATGKGTPSTLWQDLAETFSQRSYELDGILNKRWEHYWNLIAGRHGDPDSLTGSLIKGLGQGGLALAQLLDATFNATMGQVVGGWARLLSEPPTEIDIAAHVAKLKVLAGDDASFVLVAHSQGNLFLNAAYDALVRSRPETKVKVVHIAPASPTVRGPHGLSGLD